MKCGLTDEELKKLKKVTLGQMGQDRQRLLVRFPFTGGIMMRLELVPVRDCRLRTAATDGKHVFMDIDFYSKLSQADRLFVLAHEVWHCVYLHMLREQNRDHHRFNVASDMEVNRMLVKEGLPKLASGLYPKPEWDSLSAEEIYELLDKNENRDPIDRHLRPGDASASGGDDDRRGEPEASEAGEPTVTDQWGEKGLDRDFCPSVPKDLAEKIREAVVSVSQQIQRTQGKLPGHLESLVKATLAPQIRWQEVLAQFVTSAYGGSRRWLPPNRRHVGRGLYLQSSRKETLRAVVAVDTSGSTTAYLPQFFSELNGLLNSFGGYELTVIQCDAEIQDVQKYDANAPYEGQDWQSYGHGGTSFIPPFDYVRDHSELEPSCFIYITDGFGPAPDRAPPYPVLWLVTPDGEYPAEWGRRLKLKGGD